MNTEERLAVPWDEGNLVDQVKAMLPKKKAVVLAEKGVTELPLGQLNARLAPYGYVIHASKGSGRRRLVACMDEDGRVKPFGVFESPPTPPNRAGHMTGTQHSG